MDAQNAQPADDNYVLNRLEQIIAEYTSGIKGAIPEQADRVRAIRFMRQLDAEFG